MIEPTPEQEQIFSAFPGPLRIAAGAGTGKTTTIALLAQRLTLDHHLEPEDLVGITFTTRAAAELNDRIRELLEPHFGPGREADVITYHGFAAGIVTEFGPLIGIPTRAPVITPTFSRQLIHEVIRTRRFQHLDPTWKGSVDRILRFAAGMADDLVDPERLRTIAGDEPPWPERMELLAAWEDYQAHKRRLGVLDYGDLVAGAVEIVEAEPVVSERIRSRHRVVLLDEYQDTNPAQRILLQAIFGDGFPVVAVGDVDQTIYEWRGATPANFVGFGTHFPRPDGTPAREAALTLNRRSDRLILDAANAVRRRLDPQAARLRPGPQAAAGHVRLRWLSDSVTEAEWIAEEVLRLHQGGVAWKEMAVLFRNNRHIPVVLEALTQREIPVEVVNLGGLFGVREVADVRAWMRIIADPDDDPALLRILMGPRFALGMADLLPLAVWVRRHRSPTEAADRWDVAGLAEAAEDAEAVPGLDDRVRTALAAFRREYRELVVIAQGASLSELAREILDRTGTWAEVESADPARRITARLNLYRFLDLTEEWSPLEGRPSLTAFLEYLEWMEEEPGDGLDAARLSGEDAVAVLTVHRAKGLEWDAVFVPAVTTNSFPARLRSIDNPQRTAHVLPYEVRLLEDPPITGATTEAAADDVLRDQHQTQEWRVAYVAVTRARRWLYLTGAHWYGSPEPNRKPNSPSDLFELIATVGGVEDLGTDPTPERPEVLRPRERSPAPDPLFTEGWGSALRATLADPDYPLRLAAGLELEKPTRLEIDRARSLLLATRRQAASGSRREPATSVTGLVTYTACPRRFYWSEVDRLPRRPLPAARRGTEIHRRIEVHARGGVPHWDPDETDPLTDPSTPGGEWTTDPYRVYLGSPYADRQPLLVEEPFQFLTRAGLTVRGRIDAVYPLGRDRVEIVDFKTGPRRGDPWRIVQLQAYAVAADRVDMGIAAPGGMRVSFVHLGGDLEVESHDVDNRWLTEAEGAVEAAAGGIRREAFDPTPSNACRSCDFLRFCATGRGWLESERPPGAG